MDEFTQPPSEQKPNPFSATTPALTPQIPKKKKKRLSENQKSWLTFGAIALIGIAGGAYLLLLPTPQEKTAAELALEIKTFEGKGYQQKMSKFVTTQLTAIAPEETAIASELAKAFDSMDINLSFSGLREFEDGEFGAVEVQGAKIVTEVAETVAQPTADGKAAGAFAKSKQVDIYNNLIIKKMPEVANKYYYSTDGESSQIAVVSGEEKPSMITKYSGATGEFEFAENSELKSLSGNVAKLAYTDGTGTVTYATLENINSTYSREKTGEIAKIEFSLSAEKIEAGDSIKLFLGQIEPIKFNLGFAYEGDNLSKLVRISEKQTGDFAQFFDSANAAKFAAISAAEKFSGHAQLKDLTIGSGSMSFVTNFDLIFAGFPYQPVPKGSLNFSINNYPAMVEYARKFMPLDQAAVDGFVAEAEKYFSNDGTNLVLTVTLDGSRKVVLGNGKTLDFLDDIFARDKVDAEFEKSVAKEPKEKLDVGTPVSGDAQPAPIPEVQKRELKHD